MVPPILSRLRLPVIGAPLFIVSNPKLVIAQCKAGVVGSFPALNARPASQLDEWIHEITEALAEHDRQNPDAPSAPFAVNQIVHRSNDRFEHDMQVCAKWKVPIVITSLGAREELNHAVHSLGRDHAPRHHRRPLRPEGDREGRGRADRRGGWRRRACRPLVALRPDPRDPPLVRRAAGLVRGHCDRRGGARRRRRWVRTSPMSARPSSRRPRRARATSTRKRSCASSAADIVYSNLFTGIHGNYLRASIVAAGLDPENLPAPGADAMNFQSATGAKAWRDIWGSGQGVGAVDAVMPAGELVAKLAEEYAAAKARVCAS